MCSHILNAQVSVRAACCRKWFDCPQCHAEFSPDHPLRRTAEIQMICKKCRKAFRKDMESFEPGSDDHCPSCDNCYVIQAETPTPDWDLTEPDARVDNTIHTAADPRMRFDPRMAFLAGADGVGSLVRRADDTARIDHGGPQAAWEAAKSGAGAGAGAGAGTAAGQPALTMEEYRKMQGAFEVNDDDLDWS